MAAYETDHPGYRADLDAKHSAGEQGDGARGGGGGGAGGTSRRPWPGWAPARQRTWNYKSKVEVRDTHGSRMLHGLLFECLEFETEGRTCPIIVRLGRASHCLFWVTYCILAFVWQ